MKRAVCMLAVLGLAGCGEGFFGPREMADSPEPSAAVVGAGAERMIVLLERGVDPHGFAAQHALETDYVYSHAVNGLAGRIPEAAAAGLSNAPGVRAVVPDAQVTIAGDQIAPPWGLDRIDQRGADLDGVYGYDLSGAGVTAYVVDTGIRTTHQEFAGRARPGFDAFGGDAGDCNGHGTHVAGTIGGTTYGVAKDVDLVAVRVLDCAGSGTIAGVIAGLDWILAGGELGVVNMSLGSSGSQPFDEAVASLSSAGFTVVVAAGNSSTDACGMSPARAPSAVTVGATDVTDSRATFSNYGDCVDLFAPGVNVLSAHHAADDASAVLNGTSMASPHAAGAAALLMEANPGAGVGAIADLLWAHATKNVVTNGFSENAHVVNTLRQVQEDDGDPPPSEPPHPPVGVQAVPDTAEVRITVTWNVQEADAMRFELYFRRAGDESDPWQMVSGPATTTLVSFGPTYLDGATAYEFAVRLETWHGMFSALSETAIATTCPSQGGREQCASTDGDGSGATEKGNKGGGGNGKGRGRNG
ncbi:MAG TPA: S8 family peptidase [Longimicrobiales bacterium]|nr:S8 family peptidase [Longimicrobiales bacterium]